MDDQLTPSRPPIEPDPPEPLAKPCPDLPDEPTPLLIPGDPPGRPGDARHTPPA